MAGKHSCLCSMLGLILTLSQAYGAEPPARLAERGKGGEHSTSDEQQGLLSDEDVKALWVDLDSADGLRAYAAIEGLSAVPAKTLPFVREYLESLRPARQAETAHWIANLDHDSYLERERATAELAKLGELAESPYE
jgi:hypothetical protein